MKHFLILISLAIASQAIGATYRHTSPAFSFDYDDSAWEIVPAVKGAKPKEAVDAKMSENTLVTIQMKRADEKYHSRFSVVLDDAAKALKKDATLEPYARHAVDFLKGQRFDIRSEEKTVVPGTQTPAVKVVAGQRDFGLTFQQLIFLRGNDAYLLTAATRTKKMDDYARDIKAIFDSFRLGTK